MTFYTPECFKSSDFGGATLGFAGKTHTDSAVCPFELNGTMVSGTYDECLDSIPEGTWQAGVVLFGNAGGENEFINKLSRKVNAPLTGGAAATNAQTGEKALISGRGEVAVFLIDDKDYDIEVISENIHNVISEHKISYTNRWVDKIDGIDAKEWLCAQKEKHGVADSDFEHLTFSDEYGINAHLSEVDGRIFSGRDLNEKMYLRYVAHDEVQDKIQKFYDDADAVVFGCAGLKSILDAELASPNIGLFMFGEVCTVGGHSDFGNLMLSKLRITPRE